MAVISTPRTRGTLQRVLIHVQRWKSTIIPSMSSCNYSGRMSTDWWKESEIWGVGCNYKGRILGLPWKRKLLWILLSHYKNEIMQPAATWMDLDCQTEWSQTRRRNILWHPSHVESEKKCYKWTYFQNINRHADLENKLTVARGKDEGKEQLGSLE